MKRLLVTGFVLAVMGAWLPAQPPGRGGWRVPPRLGQQPEPLPWGLPAAAHLMRRAGFSAPPSQLQEVAEKGFEATLDALLDPQSVDDSAMEAALAARNYTFAMDRLNGMGLRADANNLQRWWLYRMVNSRRQLVEKMTLFWHDHFATSVQTVDRVDSAGTPLMLIQNQTLRANALGNFKEMVRQIARDPAMILWLDNFSNVAGNPNENWARELLELFTMGEGNGYTQTDIQEAARCFTGWTLSRRTGRFLFDGRLHDYEPKTFLGQEIVLRSALVGIEDGDRVIDIIFEQPAVSRFIARKLWEFFVYPNPDDSVVQPLAKTFRESGYEIKPLMRAIFTHPHFLSVKAYRAKIKSPVEFVVEAFRELGVSDPDNLPRLTQAFGLGQNLFFPPDVGGWTSDGGWINTGTILSRFNLMTCLISNRIGEPWLCNQRDTGGRGRPSPAADQIDVNGLIEANQLFLGAEVVDYFVRALVQDDVSLDTRYAFEDYLSAGVAGQTRAFDITDPEIVDEKVRGLIYLVSALPAYQLN